MKTTLAALFVLSVAVWATAPDRRGRALKGRSYRDYEYRLRALEQDIDDLRVSAHEGPKDVAAVCTWDLVHSPDSKELRDDIAIDCRPRCLVTKVVRAAGVSP
jgi:hypothetical protein